MRFEQLIVGQSEHDVSAGQLRIQFYSLLKHGRRVQVLFLHEVHNTQIVVSVDKLRRATDDFKVELFGQET